VDAGVGFAGEPEACWLDAVPVLEAKARIISKTIRITECIKPKRGSEDAAPSASIHNNCGLSQARWGSIRYAWVAVFNRVSRPKKPLLSLLPTMVAKTCAILTEFAAEVIAKAAVAPPARLAARPRAQIRTALCIWILT